MCACQNKISGRGKSRKNMAKKSKRRTHRRSGVRGLSSKSVTSNLTHAGIGAVGAYALGMILEKVLPTQYANYKNYALLGAGLIGAGMSKNPSIVAACSGASVVAAYHVVNDLADGQGVGLLPPGVPATRIAQI